MKAIRFDHTGGPDVLTYSDYDLPPPGAGQVRVRHRAIGVNFIDIYHRSGLYPVPLPSGLGSEAAGVIEALGDGVTGFKIASGSAIAAGRWAPMPRPAMCPPPSWCGCRTSSATRSRRRRCSRA